MKQMIFLILSMCITKADAQDCKNYFFLQSNKVVEMTFTDKSGNASGKQVYTVSDLKSEGVEASATVNSEVFDKKGKSIAKGNTIVKCNNGMLLLDMKMSVPQQQAEQLGSTEAKADNVYMEYPSDMKQGDILKDGNMTMELNNNNLMQTLTYTVSERKVEANESITTPAGKWECFKITFKAKMNIKTMGIGIPFSIEGIEWYVPGFGVVKTQTKGGGTELTSIK